MIGIYTQEVLGKPWGNNPGSTELLVFVLVLDLVIMLGIIWLFLKMSLHVEIREGGLHYKFPPLLIKWKTIAKDEIESFTVRTYGPVSEFDGWGIKGSSRKMAYNMSGNIGLQLYLTISWKVLFGTKISYVFKHAMENDEWRKIEKR
jgi:hypothetical protein